MQNIWCFPAAPPDFMQPLALATSVWQSQTELQSACYLCRFAELLQVLSGRGASEEVVQLVEQKKFALNSTSAAEYLRALLETKRLDRLAEGGAIQ